MKHGKKYTDSRKLVDSTKLYEPAEALDLCAKTGKAKFDETVEIHVRLGVDSRHADQQVRGAVVLPNGTGKSVRVLCFARGDAAEAAKAAGAEFVGAEDMMEKIQKLIEYYVLEREQMTCLFVLIDSRLEPQRIDLEFIEWLGENGIPFALIFTKADKQSVGKTKASVNRFLDTLKEQWEELPPHFISSSENKTGRQEILDYIEQVNRSLKEQAE